MWLIERVCDIKRPQFARTLLLCDVQQRFSSWPGNGSSGPTEPAPLQGERANPLSRGREDGVAHCRQYRGKRGLAQAGHGIIGLDEMHVDPGWGRGHAQERIVVEVALDDAALLERELTVHQGAQAIDHRSFDLIFRAAWIDDL